jgi:hypothetical protein
MFLMKILLKRETRWMSGSKEKLLLSVYTYLPPLRSDFNCIYIYKEKPTEFKHNNYILLYDKPTLVLNEYKTVKKNDILRKELPEEFVKEIKLSIEEKSQRMVVCGS